MSPEAQRIAIAEACGWYLRDARDNPDFRWCHPEYMASHDPRPETKGIYGCVLPPNYLADLNAMHEAEKVLTESQSAEYQRHLEGSRRFIGAAEFFTYHATAAQRAEAFLRAIGKWEEA